MGPCLPEWAAWVAAAAGRGRGRGRTLPLVFECRKPHPAPRVCLQPEQAAAPRAAVVVAAAAGVKAGAAAPAAGASPTGNTEAEYDVYLDKPLGIKFARGRDGGAYIVRSDSKLGNTDPRIAVGDKVVKISASFGGDVWEALNFGQVVYAVKTRNGQVYLRLRNNYGDMSALEEEELTDSERQFRAERAGGNVGTGTKEMQARNYVAKKEAERKRRELFDDALTKFRAKKIEDVSGAGRPLPLGGRGRRQWPYGQQEQRAGNVRGLHSQCVKLHPLNPPLPAPHTNTNRRR